MTHPKKELTVACSYLLRLIKAHVELSPEQINVFKRNFHDILSRRFIGHWFPATPHRGSAFRCLQTKHWKDPVLKSIAERSRLPLHRYLPIIFTMWIDPGEVAICFGDDGTWCPLYNHETDSDIQQSYGDGEETVPSYVSNDNLSNLTQNLQTLNIENKPLSSNISITDSHSSLTSGSRTASPFLNRMSTDMNSHIYAMNDWNTQQNHCWSQQPLAMSNGCFPEESF